MFTQVSPRTPFQPEAGNGWEHPFSGEPSGDRKPEPRPSYDLWWGCRSGVGCHSAGVGGSSQNATPTGTLEVVVLLMVGGR